MTVRILDARVRYLNALAEANGLGVYVEAGEMADGEMSQCAEWRGTAAQFRSLWCTPDSFPFEKVEGCRWFCPGWLRGDLHRDGADFYRYVITDSIRLTKQQEKKVAGCAQQDGRYQLFRRRMLDPVDVGSE